jgi:hypothetical protein
MDTETREQLALLTARVLGIRDVVARLLACEAHRTPDPDKLLEHFADATAQRLHEVPDDTEGGMQAHEAIQSEVDWIVASAKTMLGGQV